MFTVEDTLIASLSQGFTTWDTTYKPSKAKLKVQEEKGFKLLSDIFS